MIINSKRARRNFIIILSVVLVLCLSTGVTAALLTRGLEGRANTFTFGNLTIDLQEPNWEALTEEERITYPGKEIPKDPKVQNTGKTEAYLYLEVQIPRATIRTVNADQTINAAAPVDLFHFNTNAGWTQVGTRSVTDDGKYSVYVFAYTAAAVAPGQTTPTLFDTITFVNALEGEPEMGTQLDIPVVAIGIQSGFLNEAGATLTDRILNAYAIAKSQS